MGREGMERCDGERRDREVLSLHLLTPFLMSVHVNKLHLLG